MRKRAQDSGHVRGDRNCLFDKCIRGFGDRGDRPRAPTATRFAGFGRQRQLRPAVMIKASPPSRGRGLKLLALDIGPALDGRPPRGGAN